MIRVLISAASAILRSGLEAVVRASSALEIAGSVPAGNLRSLPETDADALLVAIQAPDEEWLRLLAEWPCPVVLLADEPDAHDLTGNLRSALRLDSRPEEIAAALQAVAEGLLVMHPASLERRPPSLAELDEPLTPREMEVLRLLAEGQSNKLIAYGLGISEHTVKFHVTQIMAKLRASSRTDAAMQGIRRGLVLI